MVEQLSGQEVAIQDNLDGWERVLGGKVDEKFCLFFDCPEDVMEVGRQTVLGYSIAAPGLHRGGLEK